MSRREYFPSSELQSPFIIEDCEKDTCNYSIGFHSMASDQLARKIKIFWLLVNISACGEGTSLMDYRRKMFMASLKSLDCGPQAGCPILPRY
jgi:hypothetical protein